MDERQESAQVAIERLRGLRPAQVRVRSAFVVASVVAMTADLVADMFMRSMERPIDLVDGLLRLASSTNDGIAFGLLQGTGTLPLALGVVVVTLVVALALRDRTEARVQVALGLIVGGALANLIERVAYGAVLDYVDMGIGSTRWPTFNVADMAISLAVVIFVVQAALPGASTDRGRPPAKTYN